MTMDEPSGKSGASSAGRLEDLLRQANAAGAAPVDAWNPPYCGDIGLRIAGDGTWFYQGSPIGRMGLVKLFARILRRDGDGLHYLVTPVEKVLVTVDDAPFLAVEMAVAGEGADATLVIRTNVDDVVEVGARHPMRFTLEPIGGGMKPYVRVRGGLDALMTRSLYFELMERVVDGEIAGGSVPGIWSGGTFFLLRV